MLTSRTWSVLFMAILLAACGDDQQQQTAQPSTTSSAPAIVEAGDVHAFRIGELAAFALRDASFAVPNDAKTFGVGRSPEDVAQVLNAAGVSTSELSLNVQPLLVRTDARVLLFDTGVGPGGGEGGGKLLASMAEAGVDPASVTDVFISHAHFDHISGLVDADGALAFANATVRMSAPEWESMQDAAVDDAQRTAMIQTLAPKIETFAPGSNVVPGVVKAIEIKGHTPGHSGYLIGSGPDSVLYIGDTAHHHIVSVQESDWTVQYDQEASTAQAERKKVIAESADAGRRIYAVHFPFPGLGKFSRKGEQFVWTPER